MNHANMRCDCEPKAASPLALRWRCPTCGNTAIMRVSTMAARCDGDVLKKVEAEADPTRE
jgi:predicted RNA-binding Zn-ribbon protein involved in translation (DUF1610 family)